MHFTEQELAGRREKVVAELQRRGLAALLIFRQESMYYLTGCYTSTIFAGCVSSFCRLCSLSDC